MTIFESNLLTSYLLPLVITIVILLLIARYILSRAMTFRQFILILSCRLISIVLICGLMKLIYSTSQEDKVRESEEQSIVLLEDRSGSMDFLGRDGKSRREIAAEIINYLKTQLDDVKLNHLCFADIPVEEQSGMSLNRTRSQIKNSIVATLQKYSPKYIYLISDGAGESLANSLKPLKQQLVNSNRHLYVTNPGEKHPDLKLSLNNFKTKNPTQLSLKTELTNGGPFETEVLLDTGQEQLNKRVTTSADPITFLLPKLKTGKHGVTVRADKVPKGDLIPENNVWYTTCEINPKLQIPDKILVLTSRFNRECREIHAELVQSYGDKVEWSLTGKKLPLDVSEVKVMVAIDIAPKDLSPELKAAIQQQKSPISVVYSGGSDIDKWAALVGKRANVNDLKRGDFLSSFSYTYQHAISLIYPVTNHDMTLLHTVKDGKVNYPLVLADRKREPRLMTIMTPNSWVWKMNKDSDAKIIFKRFWREIFAKSYGDIDQSHRIDLSVNLSQFSASIRNIQESDKIAPEFGFEIFSPSREKSTVMIAQLESDEFFYDKFEGMKSGIYLIQAFATVNGEKLFSERVPLAVNNLPIEAHNAHCNPELLANLTTSKTAKVDGKYYKDTIAEMLNHMRQEPSWKITKREKNLFGETLLFILIFVLLCLEWFLERKVMKQ